MLKRKSIYTVPLLIAIVYLTFVFVSCDKENPVIPTEKYEYDSARFNWTRDTVFPGEYDYALWIADTGNVFLIDGNQNKLLKVNNGNKTFYTFSDYTLASVLVGPDLNNGYMFGSDVTEGNTKFLIWKYAGGEFVKIQEIPIPFATRLHTGYYVSPSEIWLAGWGGFVAKYDGSSITQYQLPDSLEFLDVLADRQNKIKIVAWDFEFNNGERDPIYYIFEFDQINNNWNIVFRDTVGKPNYGLGIFVFDREIIGTKDKGIYSFDGQTFHEVINFGNAITYIRRLNGLSLTNFLAAGSIQKVIPSCGLFHWNGIRLSAEIPYPTTQAIIRMYNDRFCAFVRVGDFGTMHWQTEIYIGKKK